MNPFNQNLDKNPANHLPLTPIRFLDRAGEVFSDKTAIIHGDRRFSWAEYAERCRKLARALIGAGIEHGDTVAVMAPNIPPMLEAQFGVPLSGRGAG